MREVVDLGGKMANLVSSGKRPLGLLDLPPQLLDGSVVFPQVLAFLLLVQLDEVVHHPLVEVFTSEMGVSCTEGGYQSRSIVKRMKESIRNNHIVSHFQYLFFPNFI